MYLQRGFSLLEMAIVLLILGLLVGGLIQPFNSQIDISRTKDTEARLNTIQEALNGFIATNGRLPCPATAASGGNEAPIGGGACTVPMTGFIPGVLLGLSPLDASGRVLDAWGQPIRYAVAYNPAAGISSWITTTDGIKINSNLTDFGGLPAATPGFIKVCRSATGIVAPAYPAPGSCGPAINALVNDAIAVVYSTGPNASAIATGSDEAANPNAIVATADYVFVSHARSQSSAPNGEFDDIVMWIPRSIFISKLLAAGRLP